MSFSYPPISTLYFYWYFFKCFDFVLAITNEAEMMNLGKSLSWTKEFSHPHFFFNLESNFPLDEFWHMNRRNIYYGEIPALNKRHNIKINNRLYTIQYAQYTKSHIASRQRWNSLCWQGILAGSSSHAKSACFIGNPGIHIRKKKQNIQFLCSSCFLRISKRKITVKGRVKGAICIGQD